MAEEGWSERFTMDGVPYYHNTVTEAVTWDKPDALKSKGELESESGLWRWVPDDVDAWVPARQESEEADGTCVCVLESGARVRVPSSVPLWPLLKSSLTHLEEDLVLVDNMNEGLIIHNLRERFKRHEIYTNIGTILVSVNPFQRLPLYTPSMIDKYFHSGGNKRLPPHIFGIADAAYKAMLYEHKNQSILISGESGAGKTEATKQCLSFFAEVAGSESGVEQKVIQANPILEAFGNAKTVRNNNSSRFGKYMEIHFNKRGKIVGARTENYLLEKSRVVYQAAEERNYHIFYQLVEGSMAKRYKLNPNPEHYRYLRGSGCVAVEDVDDKADFMELCEAMDILGFTEEERDWLFSVTAAVLHLGNVEFKPNKDDTGAVVTNRRQIGIAADLLEVKPQLLEKSILSRTMEIPGQAPTTIPFNCEEAVNAVDALVKSIYGTAFDWIVNRINESLKVDSSESHRYIGVLDIFGFEIFEHNSFEQLCINFANEKLQQHFNNYTFKLEEQCYQQERIQFDHIDFIDNQPILDLIEKRPAGLLVLLDEEIRFPKVKHQHGRSDHFKRVMKVDTDFRIMHYAGEVTYDALGFLDKNKDVLYDDLQLMMSSSENSRTSELFPPPVDKGKKKTSLGGQFRQQLNDLMGKLNSTEPHYVRCVKPNSNKSPNEFQSVMSLEQLRYAGVFEAIRIRQSGYPFRRTHTEFVRRYKCLALKDEGWLKLRSTTDKELCEELLKISKQDFSDVQTGVSMMLYRAPEQRVMELLRNLSLERVCMRIQAFTRGCIARRFHARLVEARPVLRKALEVRTDLSMVEDALQFTADKIGPVAIVHPFEIREVTQCKELRRQLVERKRVSELLAEVLPRNPERAFDELSSAVEQANAIADYPGTPEQLKLWTDASEKLQLTIDRRAAREQLREGTAAADKTVIRDGMEKANALGISSCPEMAQAQAMLERIAREEEVLTALQQAIASDRCIAWTEDAQSRLDVLSLKKQIVDADAFGMKTAEGVSALALARALVDLRSVLQTAPDWNGYSEWPEVDAVASTLDESLLGAEEVQWAMDESRMRQLQREVVAPLSDAVNRLDEEAIKKSIVGLEEEVTMGEDQSRRFLPLRDELLAKSRAALDSLVHARKGLEQAIEANEEESLSSSVSVADALPVSNSSAAHLQEALATAKLLLSMVFHMPVGSRTQVGLLLDEALAGATTASIESDEGGVVAVNREAIVKELGLQLDAVKSAVAYAETVEFKEEAFKDIFSQARVILELREALTARDWPAVEQAASRAISLQINTPDVQLACDEVAGRAAAEDVIAKIDAALVDIPTPYPDQSGHPSEGVLQTALGQAEQLQMKEVESIVNGRAMLERIRATRVLLHTGCDASMYEDYVGLAEEFNSLYPLFDATTAHLDAALAAAAEFQYMTKEVADAEHFKEEIAILYNLQYYMQEGGYYEGSSPVTAPTEVVQNEKLIESYGAAAPFQARTPLGVYVIMKAYHTIQIRGSLLQVNQDWRLLEAAVAGAEQGLEHVVPELQSAKDYLEAIRRVVAAMAEAEDKVEQALLVQAVVLCETQFYENENVARVRALRDRVIELNEESRCALWILDKDRMTAVTAAAKEIRLNTPHFERIDGMLSLDEEAWLKYEIKKAKELNDVDRKIKLSIRLKVLALNQFETMFGFSSLRSLRTAQDYASAKMVTMDRKKLALGFLSFTKHPIHTSLTVIEDPVLLKEAKRAFKSVMGYMGDKKYPYPTTCAQELLAVGLEHEGLRTEIYCQIIKQITDHPVIPNKMKGWDLLALCTWQFPPNADMDNVLEVYLRNAPQRSTKYIANLRDVTYGTVRSSAPSPDEIDAYIAEFNNPMEPTRTSSFEIAKPLKQTQYTEAFHVNPEELFLETEIELK